MLDGFVKYPLERNEDLPGPEPFVAKIFFLEPS
jgi:hypothetical protein